MTIVIYTDGIQTRFSKRLDGHYDAITYINDIETTRDVYNIRATAKIIKRMKAAGYKVMYIRHPNLKFKAFTCANDCTTCANDCTTCGKCYKARVRFHAYGDMHITEH